MIRAIGWRFAAALLPRLFGTNPRSHHKGTTGRVRTKDQRLPVLCHCQLGQDMILDIPTKTSQVVNCRIIFYANVLWPPGPGPGAVTLLSPWAINPDSQSRCGKIWIFWKSTTPLRANFVCERFCKFSTILTWIPENRQFSQKWAWSYWSKNQFPRA